jgi:hypothetical protein
MYEIDGISYAGEIKRNPKLIFVKPLQDYKLLLSFSNGENKIFDCKKILEYPAYKALKNTEIFNSVYVFCGVPTWLDNTIDIAPEIITG